MSEIHYSRAKRPRAIDPRKDVPPGPRHKQLKDDDLSMLLPKMWGRNEYRAFLKRVLKRRNSKKAKRKLESQSWTVPVRPPYATTASNVNSNLMDSVGMTPAVKNSAAQILPTCHTLDDADICLSKVRPQPSRAMRWGLFDGFVGRPESTDGLALGQLLPPQDMILDYREGCAIGREISLRKEPG